MSMKPPAFVLDGEYEVGSAREDVLAVGGARREQPGHLPQRQHQSLETLPAKDRRGGSEDKEARECGGWGMEDRERLVPAFIVVTLAISGRFSLRAFARTSLRGPAKLARRVQQNGGRARGLRGMTIFRVPAHTAMGEEMDRLGLAPYPVQPTKHNYLHQLGLARGLVHPTKHALTGHYSLPASSPRLLVSTDHVSINKKSQRTTASPPHAISVTPPRSPIGKKQWSGFMFCLPEEYR